MTRIFLTSGSSTWTVPADWNNANNKIEVIGSGGYQASSSYIGGCGGGAYTYKSNVTLTIGASIPYFVGYQSGVFSTWFISSSTIYAEGGLVPTNATGALGGRASNCIPSANAFSGGAGGNGNISPPYSGGGGGSAGPAGNGGDGLYDNGGNGSGGALGGNVYNPNGAAGTYWGPYGPGGGGSGTDATHLTPGNGGYCGGGAGGGAGGSPGQGLIVITYASTSYHGSDSALGFGDLF
jgi:hypothetical protein